MSWMFLCIFVFHHDRNFQTSPSKCQHHIYNIYLHIYIHIYVYIYIWEPNLVVTAPAEVLELNNASKPSTSAANTVKFDKVSSKFFRLSMILYHRLTSFKMADKIKRNLAAFRVLRWNLNLIIPASIIMMIQQKYSTVSFKWLWSSDTPSYHRSGSILDHVMAWCLVAPSHYLIQYWLIISMIPYNSLHPFTVVTVHDKKNPKKNMHEHF